VVVVAVVVVAVVVVVVVVADVVPRTYAHSRMFCFSNETYL